MVKGDSCPARGGNGGGIVGASPVIVHTIDLYDRFVSDCRQCAQKNRLYFYLSYSGTKRTDQYAFIAMAQDIKFIRLDDDICDRLNRWADETRCRVSDLANDLIRMQLQAGFPTAGSAPKGEESNRPSE